MSSLLHDIMTKQYDDKSTTHHSADERDQTPAKKEKTTVYISHPTYPLIKAEAEAQRYSVKEYINKILEQHLEKQEFLSKVVPDLSLDSLDYEINKVVIKDSRLGRLHNVYFRNFQMECETYRSLSTITFSTTLIAQIVHDTFVGPCLRHEHQNFPSYRLIPVQSYFYTLLSMSEVH